MDFSTVEKNLKARGFAVKVVDTADQARDYLNQQIDGVSVGFGGSVTVDQLGLYETLGTHNTVHSHGKPIPAGLTADDVRAAAATADVYISSVNGLAETGEIINIDGACNRVASTLYGHKKVYFVVGRNKLAPDYDAALWRARNIAGPKNAQRLGRETPCAVKADHCYDCHSPQRICRALCVLWEAPMRLEVEVVLVAEDLGY